MPCHPVLLALANMHTGWRWVEALSQLARTVGRPPFVPSASPPPALSSPHAPAAIPWAAPRTQAYWGTASWLCCAGLRPAGAAHGHAHVRPPVPEHLQYGVHACACWATQCDCALHLNRGSPDAPSQSALVSPQIHSSCCEPRALLAAQPGSSLAHSPAVAEFWARRWNRVPASALRFMFYEPVAEGELLK